MTVALMTPAEVAVASADVVIATVVGVEPADTPGGGRVEHLTLAVQARWKGPLVPFMVRTQVLEVADKARLGPAGAIAGNPVLRLGGTYLLFMREATGRPRMPLTTGGELGLFLAHRTAAGWTFATIDGLSLRGVDAGRIWLDVGADSSHEPKPLSSPSLSGRSHNYPIGGPHAAPDVGLSVPAIPLDRRWEALVRGAGP